MRGTKSLLKSQSSMQVAPAPQLVRSRGRQKNCYFHRSFSGATSTDISKYTHTHRHTQTHTHKPLLLSWLDHVGGKKTGIFTGLLHTHTHTHTHLSELYFLFKSSVRSGEPLASPIICQCNVFKFWKPHSVLLVSLLFWKICCPRFQHTREEQNRLVLQKHRRQRPAIPALQGILPSIGHTCSLQGSGGQERSGGKVGNCFLPSFTSPTLAERAFGFHREGKRRTCVLEREGRACWRNRGDCWSAGHTRWRKETSVWQTRKMTNGRGQPQQSGGNKAKQVPSAEFTRALSSVHSLSRG